MTDQALKEELSFELEGIAGSAGFAVGRASIVDHGSLGVVRRRIAPEEAAAEMARFDQAVLTSVAELKEVAERVRDGKAQSSSAETSILDAYILMVGDVTLRNDVQREVAAGLHCVEWALESAVGVMCSQLRSSDDSYLAERSHDFEFIRDRILRSLSGRSDADFLPDVSEPIILVARDLSPAQTIALSRERVLGIITEVGTRTSHTAILARAMEIPAVVGVSGLLERVCQGDLLVVDGVHGKVIVSPSAQALELLQPKAEKYYQASRHLREHPSEPAVSLDGVRVELLANIELAPEALMALRCGAVGIGLYRTEFLYMDRKGLPTEEEQYEAYRSVVLTMGKLPVTLRTFDIGGDKFVAAFGQPIEANPALGVRAVRLGLIEPELLKTQLRAMVRASAHGQVKIMIPMVAALGELRAVKALLAEAVLEVDKAGHPHAERIELGCMVEVPAAAILADEFAKESDFLSIGTNDLVQYTMAVDRTNPQLARLASYFDPAVVQLIKRVALAGEARKKVVSVCGAMASDPLAVLLLLGLGLRHFSMECGAIGEVKAALALVAASEATSAAERALQATTAQQLELGLIAQFGERLKSIIDTD